MQKMTGGILLVAGTTIGAGMLALPIVTGSEGFVPSVFSLCLFWFVMTYTAFLILEVNLWVPDKASHLITMVDYTLGKKGRVVCWITYLFLLYSLTTAYLAGGGPILTHFIKQLFDVTIPKNLEPLPLLLIFGYIVYRGTSTVDWVNRVLMAGMTLCFGFILIFLTPHVNMSNLLPYDIRAVWIGSSILATSFGCHIIIPTLTPYLERDVQKLRLVILIGSLIPLGIYILWEFLVIGIVPLDALKLGYIQGTNGAEVVSHYLGSGLLSELARLFSLLAIITSFLGVSISLSDFLADGFKIQRTRWGNLGIFFLTFGPPLGFALTNPRAFITALEYAGAYGVMILLGIMPALMVWEGRKTKRPDSTFKAPGGKLALIATIAFSLLIIGLEILQTIGILTNG